MQLVVVPALAAVLGQRHLHTVVLTATVVQGTRVQSCEAKGHEICHKRVAQDQGRVHTLKARENLRLEHIQ